MSRDMIGYNIDILLISETKLNDSFPKGQFCITGFHTPFRKDRNDKGGGGGGLLLYVQEYIPCRRITVNFIQGIEAIVVEINFKKRKWLLVGSYCPHKEMINNHLNIISNRLNDLCTEHETLFLSATSTPK